MLLFGLLAGCAAPSVSNNNSGAMPVPSVAGAVVAADSFKHSDGLNEFMFSVAVKADADKGVYTVNAADGPRTAETQFTMPKNGAALPVFMKAAPPTAFVVGFKMPEDTTFYPYYRVTLLGSAIEMKYTHAYTMP